VYQKECFHSQESDITIWSEHVFCRYHLLLFK